VTGPNSKGEIVAAVTASVWPMIADGRVRPIIGAHMPIQQAAQAHQKLVSGEVHAKDRAGRLGALTRPSSVCPGLSACKVGETLGVFPP